MYLTEVEKAYRAGRLRGEREAASRQSRSKALLALSAKWRDDADKMDETASFSVNRYEQAAYRGAAERIRKMANELDSANA